MMPEQETTQTLETPNGDEAARNKLLEHVSYADLYHRWEHGEWEATEIDFSTDVVDWHERMDAQQRRAALWNYTLFYHGGTS